MILASHEEGVEGRADVAQVDIAGRAGGKTGANVRHGYII